MAGLACTEDDRMATVRYDTIRYDSVVRSECDSPIEARMPRLCLHSPPAK